MSRMSYWPYWAAHCYSRLCTRKTRQHNQRYGRLGRASIQNHLISLPDMAGESHMIFPATPLSFHHLVSSMEHRIGERFLLDTHTADWKWAQMRPRPKQRVQAEMGPESWGRHYRCCYCPGYGCIYLENSPREAFQNTAMTLTMLPHQYPWSIGAIPIDCQSRRRYVCSSSLETGNSTATADEGLGRWATPGRGVKPPWRLSEGT
ncbi:uncharacterized protein BO96DRAFT_406989, partial [Aspergillus niger CBS 101883]